MAVVVLLSSSSSSSSSAQKHDPERKGAPFRKGWYVEPVLVLRCLLGGMLGGEGSMAW